MKRKKVSVEPCFPPQAINHAMLSNPHLCREYFRGARLKDLIAHTVSGFIG
jgi:hypothetical protein